MELISAFFRNPPSTAFVAIMVSIVLLASVGRRLLLIMMRNREERGLGVYWFVLLFSAGLLITGLDLQRVNDRLQDPDDFKLSVAAFPGLPRTEFGPWAWLLVFSVYCMFFSFIVQFVQHRLVRAAGLGLAFFTGFTVLMDNVFHLNYQEGFKTAIAVGWLLMALLAVAFIVAWYRNKAGFDVAEATEETPSSDTQDVAQATADADMPSGTQDVQV